MEAKMARISKTLPAKFDVVHLISAGILASACPRDLIDKVLSGTACALSLV
jgi:hypothetical protein